MIEKILFASDDWFWNWEEKIIQRPLVKKIHFTRN